MSRGAFLLALLWGGVIRAQEPVTIRLDEPGTGPGPSLLARALRTQHRIIRPGSTQIVLPADSSYRRTVIVLGRDAAVASSVAGDVIVIGGDLFLRPGADIRGRAVAIGGGVYESALARVSGERIAYRDFTYDITHVGNVYALRYRPFREEKIPLLEWPGLFGIRLPTYDRSNGLSVPLSPRINLRPVTVEPRVSYRSQLGTVDPALFAVGDVGRDATVRASVEQGTFTNEAWIWPDFVNSAATLIGGDDTRNWYRAVRTQATLGRTWDIRGSTIEPYIGGRWERARSVRPDSFAEGGPWSFHGRRDLDDMLRPNPRIDRGDITSLVAGARFDWSKDEGTAFLRVDGEFGSLRPTIRDSSSLDFAQTTWDGGLVLPTFGAQSLRFDSHVVLTLSNEAPRQRWAYVGGAGSISTLDMLSRGGDQLVFLSGVYTFPIERFKISFLGSPAIAIREVLAGADVGRFPSIAQATGLRLKLSLAYVEYLVDPEARQGFLSAGLTLRR